MQLTVDYNATKEEKIALLKGAFPLSPNSCRPSTAPLLILQPSAGSVAYTASNDAKAARLNKA